MLSNYCSNIADKQGIKVGGITKLLPNLGNKSKYIVHYRNLPFYLSLGMKLIKVHRVLRFKQSDWLILIQTKEKMQLIVFKTIFFKLMISSVYGKTMENLRKRINVRLVNNAKDYKKYVSKPSFVSQI